MENVDSLNIITVLIDWSDHECRLSSTPLPSGINTKLLLTRYGNFLLKIIAVTPWKEGMGVRRACIMQICSTLPDNSSINSSIVVCRGCKECARGPNKPEPQEPQLGRPRAVLEVWHKGSGVVVSCPQGLCILRWLQCRGLRPFLAWRGHWPSRRAPGRNRARLLGQPRPRKWIAMLNCRFHSSLTKGYSYSVWLK